MSVAVTAVCFFVVALIYGSVGLGGGSSYTALLTLSSLKPAWIPVVSLSCNICVVAGSLVHFARRGHLLSRLTWPFLVSSVPCAFIGGRWPIEETTFLALLGVSLVLAGALLFLQARDDQALGVPSLITGFGVGAALGLLSGLVGIGGGIFLSPWMSLRRWGTAKQVAAASAIFILANSVSGLAGQLLKIGTMVPITQHWAWFVVVMAGGQIGSLLGSGPFSHRLVRAITGVLIVSAGLRILDKLLT